MGRRRSIPDALEALARLSNAELSPEHLGDFFREVNAIANDRGAAILLAVNLEESLEFALIRRLKIDGKSVRDVFGMDSPAFNYKIRVAYAIGMITDETRSTLNTLRKIRNAFAHAMVPISFTTPEVVNACSLLKVPQPFPPVSVPASGSGQTSPLPAARQKYKKTCETIAHNLFVVSGVYQVLPHIPRPESV